MKKENGEEKIFATMDLTETFSSPSWRLRNFIARIRYQGGIRKSVLLWWRERRRA